MGAWAIRPTIESYDMVCISDPFFAFCLRLGTPAGVGDPVTN
jgi:hypothetical protein